MFRLKVKEVAQRKGISQRKLFFRSEVDIKTIQRIYREPTTTIITIETLDKLARALGVDISELIESIPDDTPLPEQPPSAEADELEEEDEASPGPPL